jgi:hypothetical protein
MTLTLVVGGLVLAPPTGWLLGAWLADLTWRGILRRGEGRQTKAPRAGAGLGGSFVVAITGLAVPSERSKPTTSTPSRTVGFVTAPNSASSRAAGSSWAPQQRILHCTGERRDIFRV